MAHFAILARRKNGRFSVPALSLRLASAEMIFVKKITRPQIWALKIYAKKRKQDKSKFATK